MSVMRIPAWLHLRNNIQYIVWLSYTSLWISLWQEWQAVLGRYPSWSDWPHWYWRKWQTDIYQHRPDHSALLFDSLYRLIQLYTHSEYCTKHKHTILTISKLLRKPRLALLLLFDYLLASTVCIYSIFPNSKNGIGKWTGTYIALFYSI